MDHQVLHGELLRREYLLDGAFRPLLLLGLVGELEEGLLEVLVIPSALDVVEEGLVQGQLRSRLQLVVHPTQAVRLVTIPLSFGQGAQRGARGLAHLVLLFLQQQLSRALRVIHLLVERGQRCLLRRDEEATTDCV